MPADDVCLIASSTRCLHIIYVMRKLVRNVDCINGETGNGTWKFAQL